MFERDTRSGIRGFSGLIVMVILLGGGSGEGQTGAGVEDSGVSLLGPRDPTLTASAFRAIQDASRRLEDAACRQVFEDFRDKEGRSLARILESKGETGSGHLRGMLFSNGFAEADCLRRKNAAAMRPATRVVHLCPQFVRIEHADPRYAAALIIHEELHSLGLGEDPPTSAEITKQVIARCGR